MGFFNNLLGNIGTSSPSPARVPHPALSLRPLRGGINRTQGYSRNDNVSVFYWIDGRLGYTFSGELDKTERLKLAVIIHPQINPDWTGLELVYCVAIRNPCFTSTRAHAIAAGTP